MSAGMPGAGSQYSVMGRPQDPRSSMFGSSINLNGEQADEQETMMRESEVKAQQSMLYNLENCMKKKRQIIRKSRERTSKTNVLWNNICVYWAGLAGLT